jgi:hypothetical protein
MHFNRKNKSDNKAFANHEGVLAFPTSREFELYSTVVTNSLSDTFYEAKDERIRRVRSLVQQVSPEFTARLAVYTREQMYVRTMPLVLLVELAKIHSGDDLVARAVARVVSRADEITELLACYQASEGRKGKKTLNRLSKQIQKGLVQAFNRFDEYQFAKYNRDGQIKLRDALFVVHPKPKDAAQQILFDKIANQTLTTPYTWEVELSALGKQKFETTPAKEEAFRAKWEELIVSGRLGYMALLRNLRNILSAGVSADHLQLVCATLADPQQVAKARQFPFRFLAAYRELKAVQLFHTGMVLEALEAAVLASARHIEGFDKHTRVIIACDVSGSMQTPLSSKSKIMYYDVGLVLGMLLQAKCKAVVPGFFGDTWKRISLPTSRVLANVEEIHRRNGEVGYSTNGYLVIHDLLKRREVVDKVMMFTDCQMWNSSGGDASLATAWDDYRKIAPHARLYLFDLSGYGRQPVDYTRPDVALIAGWSDRIFSALQAIENGADALAAIDEIVL